MFESQITNAWPWLASLEAIETGMFKRVPKNEWAKYSRLRGCSFQNLGNKIQSTIKLTSVHSSITGKNIQYSVYTKRLNNNDIFCFENWPEVDIQNGNDASLCKRV